MSRSDSEDIDGEYHLHREAAATEDEFEVRFRYEGSITDLYARATQRLLNAEQFSQFDLTRLVCLPQYTCNSVSWILFCLVAALLLPAYSLLFPFSSTPDFEALQTAYPRASTVCRVFSVCTQATFLSNQCPGLNTSVIAQLNDGGPVSNPLLLSVSRGLPPGATMGLRTNDGCSCGSIKAGAISRYDSSTDAQGRKSDCEWPTSGLTSAKYYISWASTFFASSDLLQLLFKLFLMVHAESWSVALFVMFCGPISFMFAMSSDEREQMQQNLKSYRSYEFYEYFIMITNTVGAVLLSVGMKNVFDGQHDICFQCMTGNIPTTSALNWIYIYYATVKNVLTFTIGAISAYRKEGWAHLPQWSRYVLGLLVLFTSLSILVVIVATLKFK